MKSIKLAWAPTLSLLTVLAIPVRLAAQDNRDPHHKHHHYKLIDVGTFGGPNTNLITQGVGAQILNNRGIVTGSADGARHAIEPIPTAAGGSRSAWQARLYSSGRK
jgi:hypothetical protein